MPLDEEKGKKKKIPRRILHFSDGILEEYSTDEEEAEEPKPEPVDPVSSSQSRSIQWGIVLFLLILIFVIRDFAH